jgi:two-component system repressor protein LuxO
MLPPEIDAERATESERAASPAAAATSPTHPHAAAQDEVLPLATVERQAIERAIALCGGNMTEAAARLGVNVSTIYRKRQNWGGKAAE